MIRISSAQSAQWYRIDEEIQSMPVIDLSFVLVGTAIPLDHGYCLFSSICRIVPALHGDLRANLVKRAEDWPWSSLHHQVTPTAGETSWLAAWPLERPKGWM